MLVDDVRQGKISVVHQPGLFVPRREEDLQIDLRHCRKAVHVGEGVFVQCRRKACVYRQGIGYCYQHDPMRGTAKDSRTERE